MTGAVIEHTRPTSYYAMMSGLRTIARRQPEHELHAKMMAKTIEGQADLDQAAWIISDCDAVRTIVTVRTFLGSVHTQTQARQVCLADLVCRIQETGPVDVIKIDSLDRLGISFQSALPRPDSKNSVDMETLRALQKTGELDSLTRLFHANSRTTSQLWIPDIVGYMTARSIARADPGYMRLVAPKVELYEALTLPVAMRDSGRDALTASGLNAALAAHVAQAFSLLLDPNDPASITTYQALRDRADQERRDYRDAHNQRQPPSSDTFLGRTR